MANEKFVKSVSLINLDKQLAADDDLMMVTAPDNSGEDKLYQISVEIAKLCNELSTESQYFDEIQFFENLINYIKTYTRLLYSEISNYIFNINDNAKFSTFENNLLKVVNYVYGSSLDDLYQRFKSYSHFHIRETKNAVEKFWDHANLAKRQYSQLKQSKDEFKDRFVENIADFKQEFTKEMNAQLISLVGLFTAMSFLVFGGINSLDNIFGGAKDIEIIKIMIIGTIWGLCIQNLVFVFMFFISKLTKLSIKSNENSNANFVQKYPLMCWSNLILLFILVMTVWLYFIDYANIGGWLITWSQNNDFLSGLIGSLLILFITIIIAYKFIKMYNKSNEKEKC